MARVLIALFLFGALISQCFGGQFSISGGKVIDPNGKQWVGRGVALADFNIASYVTNAQLQPLTELFPHINFIRLACYTYAAASTYAPSVDLLTAAGYVVVIQDIQSSDGSDRGGAEGTVFTGQLLQNELNWYADLATYYKGNPYVWFGSTNEPSYNPSLAALSTWQQEIYNAVRNTGNMNIVEMEQPCGGCPGTMGVNGGLTVSVYNAMENIVFGPHFYSWLSNGVSSSVSQATIVNEIESIVSTIQTIQSKDGLVPVGCFEFGPSTDGVHMDDSGTTNVAAVFQAVEQGTIFGCLAWWLVDFDLDGSCADSLVGSSPMALTAYGQQVQSLTNQYPSYPPSTSPTPPPPTPSPPAPHPPPSTPTPPAPTPSPPVTPGSNVVVSGKHLKQNVKLWDPSKKYYCMVQDTGNLILSTAAGSVYFSTGTSDGIGKGTYLLAPESDGNIVIFQTNQNPWVNHWQTGTWNQGTGPYWLVMQSDSNLVYYDSTGKVIVSTNFNDGASLPLNSTDNTDAWNGNNQTSPNAYPEEMSSPVSSASSATIIFLLFGLIAMLF